MKMSCQAHHGLVIAKNVGDDAADFFVAGETDELAHKPDAQTSSLPVAGNKKAELSVV